jgi:alpha-amylase/alpha-mannosidase (GH57 family)
MISKHTTKTIKHPLKDLFLETLEAYIKAGEHQDGKGYWENFSSVTEIAEEFIQYAAFKDGLER